MVKELATFVGNVERCYSEDKVLEGFRTAIHCPNETENKMEIFKIFGKTIHRINRGEFISICYDPKTGVAESYSVWESKESFEKLNTPLYSFNEVRK